MVVTNWLVIQNSFPLFESSGKYKALVFKGSKLIYPLEKFPFDLSYSLFTLNFNYAAISFPFDRSLM